MSKNNYTMAQAFRLTTMYHEALRCDLRDDPKTHADLANRGQTPIDYEKVSATSIILVVRGYQRSATGCSGFFLWGWLGARSCQKSESITILGMLSETQPRSVWSLSGSRESFNLQIPPSQENQKLAARMCDQLTQPLTGSFFSSCLHHTTPSHYMYDYISWSFCVFKSRVVSISLFSNYLR